MQKLRRVVWDRARRVPVAEGRREAISEEAPGKGGVGIEGSLALPGGIGPWCVGTGVQCSHQGSSWWLGHFLLETWESSHPNSLIGISCSGRGRPQKLCWGGDPGPTS